MARFKIGDRVRVDWNGAEGVVVDGRDYVEHVRRERGDAAAKRAERQVERGVLFIRSSGGVRGRVGGDPRGEHEVFAKGDIFHVDEDGVSFVENPGPAHYPKIGDLIAPSSHLKANPAATSDTAARAIEKYQEFHRFDPKKLEEIECVIPAQLVEIGKATWVTYRSAKTDPESGVRPRRPVDYIHEHDAGVMLYMPVSEVEGGEPMDSPAWLTKTSALVKLGTCLGFGFVDEGEACEAKSTAPMPDLWTTPDGKCLLVIQGKRTVMAVMFGGGLGVEGRGIVG